MRSGAQTLVLLAAPLNVLILRAFADGAKQQAELRRKAGSPAQSTLRARALVGEDDVRACFVGAPPGGVDRVLAAMLDVNPLRRPTAQQALAALEDALRRRGTAA